MKRITTAVLVLAALSGCSASVQDLAQQGDWLEIGYRDGVKGNSQRTYKEMTSLGTVDQASYDTGYQQGVEEYCDPNHAYQIGLSGQYYEGVCAGFEDAQIFRMEWQRGWDTYNN
ncbi:DUF2799 domain-containing protein [Vibrio makurazakiensis]|uniref:DUF2799 domain-containing protein n=1 Tax=Vibrio makurazakiensis TaxID=2910250 RepID=UPI003D0DFD2E